MILTESERQFLELLAELRATLLEVISTVRSGDATTREVIGKVAVLVEAIGRRAEADGALRRMFSDTMATWEEIDRQRLHELTQHGVALAEIRTLLAPKPKDHGPAIRFLKALLGANPRVLLALGVSSVLIGIGAGLGYAVYRLFMHLGDVP